MTIKSQLEVGDSRRFAQSTGRSTMFLKNKDRTYAREEVDVKLASGRVIKAHAAMGGWMGPTMQRPYPDFEEVTPEGRINRDDLYMEIARLFSQRSTCQRGHVGCVAVRDNHIICAGYNGSPAGMPHCLDVGCGGSVRVNKAVYPEPDLWVEEFPNGCTRAIHAEQNMVAYAARIGVSLDGCVVYATAGPCLPCAQALIGAGILQLVYEAPYRLPHGLELIDKANIRIVRYGS